MPAGGHLQIWICVVQEENVQTRVWAATGRACGERRPAQIREPWPKQPGGDVGCVPEVLACQTSWLGVTGTGGQRRQSLGSETSRSRRIGTSTQRRGTQHSDVVLWHVPSQRRKIVRRMGDDSPVSADVVTKGFRDQIGQQPYLARVHRQQPPAHLFATFLTNQVLQISSPRQRVGLRQSCRLAISSPPGRWCRTAGRRWRGEMCQVPQRLIGLRQTLDLDGGRRVIPAASAPDRGGL
jgi:hypothetical protein